MSQRLALFSKAAASSETMDEVTKKLFASIIENQKAQLEILQDLQGVDSLEEALEDARGSIAKQIEILQSLIGSESD